MEVIGMITLFGLKAVHFQFYVKFSLVIFK